jgi:hypothetical protein
LPPVINGVAPGATIIPIEGGSHGVEGWYQSSTLSRSILYVTSLKTSGASSAARRS